MTGEPRGWVLYDAGCGVCARWVPFWAPTLARLGLAIAPLQEPWVAARLGLPPSALLNDLRLLLDDGTQLVGADVYRHVMRRLWWAYPLYALATAPGGRRAFDAAYRAFADRRHLLSHTCGLDPTTRRPFLTAEWRHLVLLSYDVDPTLLAPRVPPGTTLDLWRGRALVSVVGFRFLATRVGGVAIPLHRDFEEVNFRFYVRRAVDGEVRRGVVFIRELVSRAAVSLLARLAYNEPYRTVPMRHTTPEAPTDVPERLAYEWRTAAGWQRVEATAVGAPSVPSDDSEAAFVTEHYWGYGRARDGTTLEYEVEHPRWQVWRAHIPALVADIATLYGEGFVRPLEDRPASAYIADGSPVAVYPPRRLTSAAPAHPAPARFT